MAERKTRKMRAELRGERAMTVLAPCSSHPGCPGRECLRLLSLGIELQPIRTAVLRDEGKGGSVGEKGRRRSDAGEMYISRLLASSPGWSLLVMRVRVCVHARAMCASVRRAMRAGISLLADGFG